MPRASLGPRLWFDKSRENWVIRDGSKFLRTGAAGWRAAEAVFNEYMEGRPQVALRPQRHIVPTGFVYFLTADVSEFPIKIGFTRKPDWMRVKGIQTGCPYKIIIMGAFPGTYSDENDLHRRFAAQRLEGEWFSRSPALMELIAEKAPEIPDVAPHVQRSTWDQHGSPARIAGQSVRTRSETTPDEGSAQANVESEASAH